MSHSKTSEGDPNERSRTAWHSRPPEQVLDDLGSDSSGISDEQARRLLEKFGRNELKRQKQRPWWRRLFDQLNNILIIILLIAGVVSGLLDQWVDAVAIFAVVAIITLIGFFQEGKAESALNSIKNMLSPKATVQRSGERREIPAEELVPGDIVHIESGDRVPADLRLLKVRRLRTEEAALTGESEPVDKDTARVPEDTELGDRQCMAYASTLVAQGNAQGVVVETGAGTEIGRISTMLGEVDRVQTPLLRQLDRAGRVLAYFILSAAAITGIFGIVVHGMEVPDAFMASVALAVAAIPEGLPAIVTITLALGVQAMAKRNAIVRRLPAVETLGSTSIIFSDKTGTLTRNEMTAQRIALAEGEVEIDGIGYAPEGDFYISDTMQSEGGEAPSQKRERLNVEEHPLLKRFLTIGLLCNDAGLRREEDQWTINGDPTEAALVVAAEKAGLGAKELRERFPRRDVVPFESERKYMATLDQYPDKDNATIHVKGAPDRIIEMCSHVRTIDGDKTLQRDEWERKIEELSSQGLRVLALAEKAADNETQLKEEDCEDNLVLLGLVGLLDPPREAVVDAIKTCLKAGIRPVMVTGDHALTARAIGEKLGLQRTDKAITGKELQGMSEQELSDCFAQADIYARAAPEHKLRLVKAAQASGHVCAMTGDGVNDAPALKRADVGVAMGIGGTEAAQEAAEIVLADDNFASIVNAVEEGRKVYDNIKKTIIFMLPTNGGQGLAIAFAVLAGIMLPITPVQALWVNMIVAVTLGLALGFEPGEAELMHKPPRDSKAPLLDMFLLWRVIFVSVLLLLAVYGMFLWLLVLQETSVETARSGAVNVLVMGSVAYLLNSRFITHSSCSLSAIMGSRPVLISIAAVIVFQLAWTYLPPMQLLFGSAQLELVHWLVIIIVSALIFLLVEAEKAIRRKRLRKRNQ
ncbi:HAD-IC family P-type ATPase [Marinimicrobium sp. ABcell2]|uniref:cation-translocating P-type ATPase n=1 Tax=Marinimicrobium sp. ABcell2 TaxID=3069751 RepID=UPI0027B22BE9|nr:HAD-IC family P-type ATPase [Marinimicrobium sp. ABcell2]MDQ2075304.1 HAD-IC family P-type ATPase [Marinimicrobium sp. ABcell2]